MLKLFLLSFLFAIVTSEVDMEQFYGKWRIFLTYPYNKMALPTMCDQLEIARKNTTVQCQCGDRNNVPIMELTNTVNHDTRSFLVLTVNTSAEVESTLKVKCKCDGKSKRHIVIRPFNENFFIEYDYQDGLEYQYSEKEPNTANLFVKKVPSIAELKILSKFDDLRKRIGSLLCLPALLYNETSQDF